MVDSHFTINPKEIDKMIEYIAKEMEEHERMLVYNILRHNEQQYTENHEQNIVMCNIANLSNETIEDIYDYYKKCEKEKELMKKFKIVGLKKDST